MIIDRTSTQTAYDRFAVLSSLFRQPGQTVPQPISIVCQATAAHNIDKVIFKKLSHKYDNKRDQLTVNIELVQNVPQTITAVSAAQAAAVTPSKATGVSNDGSNNLDPKYSKYLQKGRGNSPATNFTGDVARGAMIMAKIAKTRLEGD